MGLFKPAWQHINKEKALAAAASETNQKKLIEIAKKALIPDVRKVAVEKLSDQSALVDVAKTDIDAAVSKAAVNKLTEQTLLLDVVNAGKNTCWITRLDAINRLTDQELITKLAIDSSEWSVRQAAVNKLTDKAVLINEESCGGHDRYCKSYDEQQVPACEIGSPHALAVGSSHGRI